ncbi:MAG: gamma-glutamyltransferase, partial [Acidobacteriota bacterium]
MIPSRHAATALLSAVLLALLAPAAAAAARGGVVVAADPTAAAVGAAVLEDGGNAVDAAVATAFALAVTYPQAGNLGGGGFAVGRDADGTAWALDFRERAPGASTPEMFLDETGRPDPARSRTGPLSVGVPGSVAGLLGLLERSGTLSRGEALSPAIRLAEDGFVVPEGLHRYIADHEGRLAEDPYTASVFLPGGAPPAAGARLVQSDLAATLRRIARRGASGFYRGPVARDLADRVQAGGGILDVADLRAYRVVPRQPLRGTFRGREVITMPPPSAGGLEVLQMLALLDGLEPADAANPVAEAHRLAGVMQVAFADRSRYLGDPDHVEVPVARLLCPAHLDELRARIPAGRALSSAELAGGEAPGPGPGETTHLSVIDAEGNAVALTTTLNSAFGAAIAVPGRGFLLNNEMDDFAAAPGQPNLYGLVEGPANAVAPGKRMVSSMSPTIVVEDGRPRLVLGSPGG